MIINAGLFANYRAWAISEAKGNHQRAHQKALRSWGAFKFVEYVNLSRLPKPAGWGPSSFISQPSDS